MTVPSEAELYRALTSILGDTRPAPRRPRASVRPVEVERWAHICEVIDEIAADYAVPTNTRLRREIYLGPGRPTIANILTDLFLSVGDPTITEAEVQRLHEAYEAAEPIYGDLAMLTVVMLREHHSGLIARGDNQIETYSFGGLDSLGREMTRMAFLPEEVLRRWQPATPFEACERICRTVHPALIPAHDEIYAYAATVREREDDFRERLHRFFPDQAGRMLAEMTVPQRRAWTQLSFGRQNGNAFVPAARTRRGVLRPGAIRREERQFAHRQAGLVTVLGAMASDGARDRYKPCLASIFTNPRFSSMASVCVARVRAAEAEVLERLGLFAPAPLLTH